MKWSFKINEISSGCYSFKGIRNSGHTVDAQGNEKEIHKILKLAYDLEVEQGTLPSQALYLILSYFKYSWEAQYHDEAFGSWLIKNKKKKLVYDGKDFLLSIYVNNEKPVWEGIVRKQNDAKIEIFRIITE